MDPLAGKRILVVEDEVLVAIMLASLLEDAGCCVVVGPVSTIGRALELLREGAFDAAVLDVNLGRETTFASADALGRSAQSLSLSSPDTAACPRPTRKHPQSANPSPRRGCCRPLRRVMTDLHTR